MCVKCWKVFCNICLHTHLELNGRSCPHCRAAVEPEANAFVNVKWLPELLAAVERSPDSALSETAIADTCLLHPSKQLTLFCTDCKVSCCVDCTKTDHCNHRLMALEVANQEMRRRYESLTGKIDTVNKLVRDFDVDIAKIANLKREGERRIDALEIDLRRRLREEVGNLEARLKSSRKGLYAFMNVAPPLIASIESKMTEAARDRFADEASRLDDLTRVVNDAMSEPAMLIPDSLNIEVQPLWSLPTATPTVPVLTLPLPPRPAANDASSSSASPNPFRMSVTRLRSRLILMSDAASVASGSVQQTFSGHQGANL